MLPVVTAWYFNFWWRCDTHYATLYPQNGDSIVVINSLKVTCHLTLRILKLATGRVAQGQGRKRISTVVFFSAYVYSFNVQHNIRYVRTPTYFSKNYFLFAILLKT